MVWFSRLRSFGACPTRTDRLACDLAAFLWRQCRRTALAALLADCRQFLARQRFRASFAASLSKLHGCGVLLGLHTVFDGSPFQTTPASLLNALYPCLALPCHASPSRATPCRALTKDTENGTAATSRRLVAGDKPLMALSQQNTNILAYMPTACQLARLYSCGFSPDPSADRMG